MQVDILINEESWKEVVPKPKDFFDLLTKQALFIIGIAESLATSEVSILLTNDAEIKQLNKDYRNKDSATNVLSFEGCKPSDIEYIFTNKTPTCEQQNLALGDIVLSLDTIKKEAKEQGKDLENHVKHLYLHGLLHLLGYNHLQDSEAEEMEALEIKVLNSLNVPNPYAA